MSSNLALIYSEFNFNVLSDFEITVYLFENYRLDVSRKMLYRDGEGLPLPPKAVETLLALIKRPGEIVGKDELINQIWTDTIVEESNLAHYLHVLRKTFGNREDGKPYIETLRRRGYRFNPVGEVSTKFCEISIEKDLPDNFVPAVENDAFFTDDPDSSQTPESFHPKNEKHRKRHFMLAAFISAVIFGTLVFVYNQKFSVSAEIPVNEFKELSITNLTDNSSIFSASISRDGKYFTYVEFEDKKYHLYLQQTGQTTRLEIIPPSENSIGSNTFSPSGEFIYFVSFKVGGLSGTLYRVPKLGGTMTKILDGITSPVSFSPDGSEMVFARFLDETREHALVISASDGSRERILLTLDGSTKTLANGGAWSPDGKTIAFGQINSENSLTNNRYSIIGFDLQSGETKELSREKWANCFRMDWTRDGAGLIFIGTRAGEGLSLQRDQVYYLSVASGESRRITNDGSRYDSFTMSTTDDNSVLAILSNRLSQIYEVETGDLSNSGKRLTNGQTDGRGGIAALPDGRIGFISRIGENIGIWTMNADGTERKQIFDEFPFLEELRASPDGKYFIFSAPRNDNSHLFRIDSNGGNLKQITGGESNEVDSTISPDSRWFFYVSSFFDGKSWKKQLRKTAIDGSETTEICDINGNAPHISPDGKFISLIENDKIQIYSAEKCELLKTLDTIKPSIINHGASWSPDGSLIYPALDKKDIPNLWQQPLNGSAPQQLTKFTNGSIYFYAFASDGSKIYMARGDQIRNAVLIKNFK